MNRQTFKMSLGFIAVVAVALVLAGNAWADVLLGGASKGTPYNMYTPESYSGLNIYGGSGTLNQYSGTITGGATLGYAGQGTTWIWNMSGGSATMSGLDMASQGSGYASSDSALVSISGGTLTVTSSMQVGGTAKVTYAVSGTGTFNQTGGAPWVSSTTNVEVTGGNATMNLKDWYFQSAGSQIIGGLKFTLTNSTGRISTIWDQGTSYNFDLSNAGNAGKIDIVEATPGLVTIGQKFDLLKIDQGLNIMVPGAGANSLLNAGDTAAWSLAVVSNKGGLGFDVLELTALAPEPATMALLAIGGLGMLIRRRRR